MTNKRAFRPASLDGENQLEARVALSHFAIRHAPASVFHPHAKIHPRFVAQHPASAHARPVLRILHAITNPTTTSTTSVNVSAPSSPPTSTPSTIGIPVVSGIMSAQEQTIVDLVNQQRAQAGLAPLQVDLRLVEAAQIQSTDMAELGQMEHTLSGAALPTMESRAQYVGYNYTHLGENIAFNYPDDNSVMTAWMNSTGHRANILDPDYTQIGVGIAYDSQGEPYYTQEFGQPA